ncbi:MAG: ABC transporter permease subunit [Gammaproteobacteria bacterium]|nr:ABC transporter permease subunit [Gammaproteobacteria bacterium]MYD80919.1 ABC transporter permease subunit [Gammaproteobacteria bacterium]
MNNVLVVALDYLRALLHRRLLIALVIVVLLITLIFFMVFASVSRLLEESQQLIAVLVVFYAITSFCGCLVAIYVGASAIHTEISQGSIAMILARPVSRWQFLLGKYIGAVAVLLGYSLAMGGLMAVYILVFDLDALPATRYAPWMTFCQFLIMGTLALVLSTIMHPSIAAVLAFFSDLGWVFEFFVTEGPFFYISYALPSYNLYNVWIHLISTTPLYGWGDVTMLTLYAFDLALIFFLLAMWRLRYKEVT